MKTTGCAKLLGMYLLSLFSILLLSCSNDQKELEQPVLVLDKDFISMVSDKDIQSVGITANGDWTIEDIPAWISIDVISGNTDTEIAIITEENREPESREAILKFVRNDVVKTLTVEQHGQKDVIRMPGLPISHFTKLQCTILGDKKYTFGTDNLFVNPAISNNIYLGNLVSHNAESNTDIPVFTGYTFNPITVWIPAPVAEIKTYLPSWAEQHTFAKQVIEGKPKQNESFFADNGTTEFYTHEQLYAIGVANLGVKLDELVSGSSYMQKEMTKKYGVIYCFKQVLFSLYMDLPAELLKEEVKEADKAKGMSYISGVNYGKVGLLIVESDTDSREVRVAINKMMSNVLLSQEETSLVNAADIYYVYFGNDNKVQVKKGNPDAINAYKEGAKNVDNIYPVGFSVSDCVTHVSNTISFSFKVPVK